MPCLLRLLGASAALAAFSLALVVGLFGDGRSTNGGLSSRGFWGTMLNDGSTSSSNGRPRHRELSNQSGRNKRARLAYLILSSGNDIGKLHLLLPEIYHPDNIYLVHVDAKAPRQKVEKIREVVKLNFPPRDGRPSNGRLLEPAGIVSWGGFSLTLACLYGIATSLMWDDGWDYFINLSTADFPVVTAEEMQLLLGEYADSRVNFLDGSLMTGFEKRWQGYVEDQGLQRDAGSHTTAAMTLLGRIERPHPELFDLYKGEFWSVLHRSFCDYISWSPDNVARSLSAYFTAYRISDESFFQTVACHPEGVGFPIIRDNLRFTSWNEDHKDSEGRKVDAKGNILIHPEPLRAESIHNIKLSGALFARKFDYVTSYQVYVALQYHLRNREESAARMERVRQRIGVPPEDARSRDRFCNADEALRHRGLALGERKGERGSVGGGSDGGGGSRGGSGGDAIINSRWRWRW